MLFADRWFQLWLPALVVDSGWKLATTCCGLATLSALYEALRAGRTMVKADRRVARWRNRQHWIQVLLHLIQVTVSYLLMLAVMTCSPWVLLSVCLGSALGYAAFAGLRRRLLGPPPEGAEGAERGAANGEEAEEGCGTYHKLDEERKPK